MRKTLFDRLRCQPVVALTDAPVIRSEHPRGAERPSIATESRAASVWRQTIIVFCMGILATFASMAAISGKVVDVNGVPLSGAVVALEKSEIQAISRDDGSFSLDAPGTQGDILAMTKTGFLTWRGLVLTPDANVTIRMIVCADTATDIDGNVYQAVRLGNQVWTVTNLRTKRFNDGSPIPFDAATPGWKDNTTPLYCFLKDVSDPSVVDRFGLLYNFYAVDTKKLAPVGWHVPTAQEWVEFEQFLIQEGFNWDGSTVGDKIAKAIAAGTDWNSTTVEGAIGNDLTKNNASGFSAYGTGFRHESGIFEPAGRYTGWWTSTPASSDHAGMIDLHFNQADWSNAHHYRSACGYPVRLIRDYRGKPFNDAAYRAEQQAKADRPALPFGAFTEGLVVWNGTTLTNGSGWIHGAELGASVSLDEPDADGKRAIHFHASSPNYRQIALGWQWAAEKESGVNPRPFGAVSFSLKITGSKKMEELFFEVNADDSAPVSIRPFQPSFLDGSWHRVTIPLSDIRWNPASTNREIRGFTLSTFVWDAADFDIFVGNISFEREATPTRSSPTHSATGQVGLVRGQPIPGRLECAFYDLGGESVAYHDTTPINILGAVLNQRPIHQRPHATAYHWDFRKDEGVDVSFVKDFADLNHTNLVDPPINQLYIGGTEDGEWCKYTIDVKNAGTYKIMAAYGNIAGMKPLRFSVDGKMAVECPCPVVTGGMHKWTREEIGRITFPEAGVRVLTLHYERGYNLGYFDFEEVK